MVNFYGQIKKSICSESGCQDMFVRTQSVIPVFHTGGKRFTIAAHSLLMMDTGIFVLATAGLEVYFFQVTHV
jgi:hypothetical protein